MNFQVAPYRLRAGSPVPEPCYPWIETMRRSHSSQGRNAGLPAQDTDRRSAAIAAMGYRLAAAGPRTRQRLIERETVAPLAPGPLRAETPIATPPPITEPMPALASWDDAWWEQRLATDAELGIVRRAEKRGRFPIWRAAALLASAACGFSLVLFGQSLHLDRKLRQPNRQPAPAVLAEAQKPAPPPVPLPPRASAPPAAPAPPEPVQTPSAPPPEIPPAAIRTAQRTPPPAAPSFADLARPPLARTTPRLVLAMATRPAVPKSVQQPKPRQAAARHDLPRWLTEDRPQHERELIMSPPPHNLDAPASPKPPEPQQHPALIYAEAHTAPAPYTGPGAPHPLYNATPYYGALPPPTPYYQP
jgi:hypothetical protein